MCTPIISRLLHNILDLFYIKQDDSVEEVELMHIEWRQILILIENYPTERDQKLNVYVIYMKQNTM